MKNPTIAIAALVLITIAQAAVARPKLVLELSHEADARMVRLPETATGELTMQVCATCKVLRLRATARTRYVLGDQPVTLTELTRYLARNPSAEMMVAQVNGSNELSRILVPVPTPAK
jgi:hypothetical protein